MSESDLKELQALVLAKRSGARSGPFPPEVRKRLVGYLKSRWQAGESLSSLSRKLGLSEQTVAFWKRGWDSPAKESSSKLRAVTVAQRPTATFTMHGPSQTRLEGLTLEQAAEVWRKLS